MLILVKGDVSTSHHFFNLGEDESWQISRLKCWNAELNAIIDESKYAAFGDLDTNWMATVPSFVVLSIHPFDSHLSGTNSPLIHPDIQGNQVRFSSPFVKFLLESDGNDFMTAKFQLLHNGIRMKEVTGSFEDYQVRWSQ